MIARNLSSEKIHNVVTGALFVFLSAFGSFFFLFVGVLAGRVVFTGPFTDLTDLLAVAMWPDLLATMWLMLGIALWLSIAALPVLGFGLLVAAELD